MHSKLADDIDRIDNISQNFRNGGSSSEMERMEGLSGSLLVHRKPSDCRGPHSSVV